MNQNIYDLVIIGAGPGGYVAAIRAAQLGFKTACVEKTALGGTCLNVGCIPSKALLDSSELYYEASHSFLTHGIQIKEVEFDLSTMLSRKDKIVQTMTRGVGGLFKKNKVDHYQGLGRIKDAQSVEIDSEGKITTLTTRRIMIATGSAPVELPHIKFDGNHIISSTEALDLKQVPKRLLVIGAGAIGLELGSVWSRLGSEVTVVELQSTILPGMDQEMTSKLQKLLEKQGLQFFLQSKVESCELKEGQVNVLVDIGKDRKEELVDKVLMAVGRRPYTDNLGLDNVGIKTNHRGQIEVDPDYQTNAKGIYAIGDVISGFMLAHKAEEEGIACVEKMAGVAGHVNYNAIPGVVYTHPELASVGITEEGAKEKGIRVKIGKFPYKANGRAMCLDEPDGWVKVIADEKTDRLLGLHILAPRASDMIAEAALAMEFYASAEDIARSVHAHPTLPEAIKEAALAVDNRAIHI